MAFDKSRSEWVLSLIVARARNRLSGVAKFTACGATMYYPGGVPEAVMDNKDDVLNVFDTLSWTEWVGGVCTSREQVFEYPVVPPNPPTPNCP